MESPVRMPIHKLENQAKSKIEHRFVHDPPSIPDTNGLLLDFESRETIAGKDEHASNKHRDSEFSLEDAQYLTAHVISLKGLIAEAQHCSALLQGNPDGSNVSPDAMALSALNGLNGSPPTSGELKYSKGSGLQVYSHPPVFICDICNMSFAKEKLLDLHVLSASHMGSLANIVGELFDEMVVADLCKASIPGIDGEGPGQNYCWVCDSRFKNEMQFMIHFGSMNHVLNLLDLLWDFLDSEQGVQQSTASSKTSKNIRGDGSHSTAEISGEEILQYPGYDKEITERLAPSKKEPAVRSTLSERYGLGISIDNSGRPFYDPVDPLAYVGDSSEVKGSRTLLKRQCSFQDRADERAEESFLPLKKRLLRRAEADEQLGGTTSAPSTDTSVPEPLSRSDSFSSEPSLPKAVTALPEAPRKPTEQSENPKLKSFTERTTLLDSESLQHSDQPLTYPEMNALNEANQMTHMNHSMSGYIARWDMNPPGANIETVAMMRIHLNQQDVHLRRAVAEALGDQNALAILPTELDAAQTRVAIDIVKEQLHSLKTRILTLREADIPFRNLSPPCPNVEETTINLCHSISQLQQYIETFKELLASYRQAVLEGKPTNAMSLLQEEDAKITQEIQRLSFTVDLISERPDLLKNHDEEKNPIADSRTPELPRQRAPRPKDLNLSNRADSKFTEKQLNSLNQLLLLGRLPTDDELRGISRKVGLTCKTIKNWLAKNMNKIRAETEELNGETDSGIGSPPDVGCENSASPGPRRETSDELTPPPKTRIHGHGKSTSAAPVQTKAGPSPQVERKKRDSRRG